MGYNTRKANEVYGAICALPCVDDKVAVLIGEALDDKDRLWKQAIKEVLKGNPCVANDFLEALSKISKALRETLQH